MWQTGRRRDLLGILWGDGDLGGSVLRSFAEELLAEEEEHADYAYGDLLPLVLPSHHRIVQLDDLHRLLAYG